MATSKTSEFYYKYKKSDLLKAVEYFNSQLDLPVIPVSLALEATKALNKNNIDIETDHEIRNTKQTNFLLCHKIFYS